MRTFIGHKIRLKIEAETKAGAKITVKSIKKTFVAVNKLFRQVLSCLPGVSMEKDEWSGTQGEGGKKVEGASSCNG